MLNLIEMLKNKKHIGILEDDQNYRKTLERLVESESDFILGPSASRANEILGLLEEKYADLLLVDIQLPDADGSQLVRKIKSRYPQLHCVMCTTFMNSEYIITSLSNGASGYIIKTESADNIIQAIRDILKGGAFMSRELAGKIVEYFQNQNQIGQSIDKLTERENEVLYLLNQGLLYKEVADQLNLSIDTIKKHTSHIYRKLEVSNKTEALNIYNKKNKS